VWWVLSAIPGQDLLVAANLWLALKGCTSNFTISKLYNVLDFVFVELDRAMCCFEGDVTEKSMASHENHYGCYDNTGSVIPQVGVA